MNNVKTLFKDHIRGYGDPTHETSHDPSHALDLAKKTGVKAVADKYMERVHTAVKAVYAHYSQSPKRTRSLLRLCDEWNVKNEELHYLFEVRLVASETLVLRSFLTDLAVIALHLRQELTDDDIASTAQSKIKARC